MALNNFFAKGMCCLVAAAGLTRGVAEADEYVEAAAPLPEEVRKSFSFGYYPNGWRKVTTDTSPDTLCFETGYYGFLLDMDDLTRPRFGLFDDAVDYQSALESGLDRLDALKPADLAIELEVAGKTYRAVTCKSGKATDIGRMKSTRLWESGRFVQHFEVQDLDFRDAEGNALECYGDLHLVGWPQSLTLNADVMPDTAFIDGPGEGVDGAGLSIVASPFDIPHNPQLDPTNLTVECWVMVPERSSREDGWLLCKNENEWVEGNFGIALSGKRVRGLMNIGGGRENVYTINQTGELSKGAWHHLALTYDGTTMSLYVDGHPHGTNAVGKVRVPGTGLLRIGQRADGVTNRKAAPIVNGIYDEIRVWNRALSHAEVLAHKDKPGEMPSRDGLVYHRDFNELRPPKQIVWSNATVRLALTAGELAWKQEKQVKGLWKQGQRKQFTLACNLPGAPVVDDSVSIRVSAHDDQDFPVAFAEETNCRKVHIGHYDRTWEQLPRPDSGAGNNIDEFLIEAESTGTEGKRIPFQFYMRPAHAITGIHPQLCEEDGTPTGIPVQLSKNWHDGGAYLEAFTLLPVKPGVTRYKMRIIYGFYGTLPAAHHAQLSLVGYGGNGRWDQLAIGSWGETFCLDMDMSLPDVAITDIRGLYLRNGKDGEKWGWSDGGWGGDWLGIKNSKGEKLAFSQMKTAYLAHGTCLTDVRYDGAYGPGPEADLAATVRTLRVDDFARTFNTLKYTFNKEVSTEGAWLYKMGGGAFVSPKIAYGNRDGLLAEHDVPQGTMKPGEVLREPVTLEGEGPWWVSYPGGHIGDGRTWGTGSRSLVIRNYRASFDGQLVEHPTIAFPVNSRRFTEGQTDINLHLIPPTNVTAFLPGDFVELDMEWIVVPRVAGDYYGPNEAFRKHLEENPRSWKTVHRAAVGNDLELKVTGGTVTHNYPIIIQAEKDFISVDIKGGLGIVPIRFDGLATTEGYGLYEVIDGKEVKLDQSVHGNDFWQTDLDTGNGTYRMSFNIPLDGKETSRWVLKKEPTSVAAAL